MLKDKYSDVLKLGEELGVKDGFVKEEGGKLKIGGTASYAYDKDRLWDKIKHHAGWENEVEVELKVAQQDVYGMYTVKSGDTLSKISKELFGNPNRYMEIYKLNTDQLKNPDLIKVGQSLKLPTKHK